MSTDMMPVEAAALKLIAFGPVLALKPGSKEPLTRRGVHSATTDPEVIRRMFAVAPAHANLAIATGRPGPTVLDIDRPELVPPGLLRLLDRSGAPTVATARGLHYYFAGLDRPTVTLEFGELKGTGGYVVCPPSTHASGKLYTWLREPRGPLPELPEAVVQLIGERTGAGAGEHQAPAGLIPYGNRHAYLVDFAVRQVRAGITDERRLLAHLKLEFRLSCVLDPPPAPGALEALARWGSRSEIARRERLTTENSPMPKRKAGSR